MGVIEYELLLDGERKPVLVKKNSEFSDADDFLDSPSTVSYTHLTLPTNSRV